MVYKNLTANNKYPFVVLNLEIPPHDVDVNVHPTKKEVRYKNPNQIFNFVYSAIEAGLSNYVEKNYPANNTVTDFSYSEKNEETSSLYSFHNSQKSYTLINKQIPCTFLI